MLACGRLSIFSHHIVASMLFLGIDCFSIHNCLESWGDAELHQFKHYLAVFIKPEYEYTRNTEYPTVLDHDV